MHLLDPLRLSSWYFFLPVPSFFAGLLLKPLHAVSNLDKTQIYDQYATCRSCKPL